MYKRHLLSIIAVIICVVQSRLCAQALFRCPQPGFIQTEVYHWDYTAQYLIQNNSVFLVDDTIVGQDTFYRYARNSPVSSFAFTSTYDSGRVFFNPPYSNPSGGLLLYDFSLQLGDTFNFPTLSFMHSGAFVVDSVDYITLLNSQVRKYLRLTNGSFTVEWIDAIGDIRYGFVYMTSWEGSNEEFICNQDSTGPVYSRVNSTFNCDPFNPVSGSGPNNCNQFNFNTQVNGTSCIPCSGSVIVTNVSGGTPGYSYLWSNGDTTASASGLCEGPLTLTITDSVGMSCSRTFYIAEQQMNAVINEQTVSCAFTACASVSGGTSPYVFIWTPPGFVGNCFTWSASFPLTSTVTVVDANGCMVTDTITFPAFIPPAIIPAITLPSCPNCCDGNVTLNITGGHPPFTISGLPSANTFCQGWYPYCVTDSMGCTYCDSVYVPGVTGLAEISEEAFTVYPVPAADEIIIERSSNERAAARLTDVNGHTISEWTLSDQRTRVDVTEIACGIYFLSIGNSVQRIVITRE